MDALSLKDVQLRFVHILLGNFKCHIFIYFSLRKMANKFSILTKPIK